MKFTYPKAAPVGAPKHLIVQNVDPRPDRSAELARIDFVARRGVPPAQARIVAELCFATRALR